MSASQGCTDDKAVVESFKEALKQRIGDERFRMWFTDQVGITCEPVAQACQSDSDSDSDSNATGVNVTATSSAVDGSLSTTSSGMSIFSKRIVVTVKGEFAQQRLSRNLMPEMRGAAMQACEATTDVVVNLLERPNLQAELPLGDDGGDSNESRQPLPSAMIRRPSTRRRKSTRGQTAKLESLITQSFHDNASRQSNLNVSLRPLSPREPFQPSLPFGDGDSQTKTVENNASSRTARPKRVAASSASQAKEQAASSASAGRANATQVSGAQTSSITTSAITTSAMTTTSMTLSSFVVSDCNRLAHTAASLVVQTPGMASPLFLAGPTGVGKTHLLTALADTLRRHHRMRRVVHASAERFTNEFISAIRDSSLTSFRRRYRDVDALLIDDVQFLGKKTSTLREMLYTVDELAKAGRPMIFSGSQTPNDTPGLSAELAGRMAAGLVCNVQAMDLQVRTTLLRRMTSERCEFAWPDDVINELSATIAGDGRTISGVVNLVSTLQRMFKRMPSIDEIRQFGGDLLRTSSRNVNLSTIERAVCEAFQIEAGQLKSHVQTRSISEPRMLAMYLSREMTSSAFAEIARHFGGRSHSTAIMASKRVQQWLENGKTIGRGVGSMSAQEALNRIENILRAG